MKIAVYGTSRSGKDHLIAHIIEFLKQNEINTIQVPGSKKLNELAERKYGRKFKFLTDEKRHILREDFIELLSQYEQAYEVVFVDGHFAFPKENGFDVVFTEADKNCYDHFFYLDTASELILENFRKSLGEKKNSEIQLDDINAWKSFEIDAMQKMCVDLKKELVILDEDTQTCVEFALSWIKNFNLKYDYQEITKGLIKKLLNENKSVERSKALVIDCDNTFATNDTTYDFCNYLRVDNKLLKQIFWGDRYSSYQFFKANKLYSQFDIQIRNEAAVTAKQQINISPDLEEVINQNKYSLVIALTAGLTEIWQPKVEDLGGVNSLFGNTSNLEPLFFVTPLFKKYFVDELKNNKLSVTAIGDSIIDVPMLESSDKGFIIAHNKINKTVMEYFKNNESKIAQLFATEWHYPIKQMDGVN